MRRLFAAHDESVVWVVVAHSNEVAEHAISTGSLAGPAWKLNRTTRFRLSSEAVWARSEHGEKVGRERMLAIALERRVLESLLGQSATADFDPDLYPGKPAWRLATRHARVLVQWHDDPVLEGSTPRISVRDHALAAFTDGVRGVRDLRNDPTLLGERTRLTMPSHVTRLLGVA